MDSHLEMDYEDRTHDDFDVDNDEGCGKWGCRECYPDDDKDCDTWGWEAATGYEDGGYEDYEPSPYDGTYSEC
jgi:hypothetical protein